MTLSARRLPRSLSLFGVVCVMSLLAGACAGSSDSVETSSQAGDESAVSPGAVFSEGESSIDEPAVADSPASRVTGSDVGDDGWGRDGCCSEGRLRVLAHAKSAFDPWTEPTGADRWRRMRALYDSMIVYAPYFDERLALFDDVFVYRDLYGLKVDSESDRRAVDHPDWVLRSSEGDPVYIPWGCARRGCPQFAADITNLDYRDHFIATVRDLVEAGYAGLLIDDVNLEWRFSDEQGNRITPVDSRTGNDMRLEDWRRYVAEFVEAVREEFPDLRIMHNSIWYADSPGFDDPAVDRQIAAADVIMLERGATDAGLVNGDGRYGYETFLDYIDEVHRLGANVLLLDEDATTEREQIFNLATGLLVNDGQDIVSTEDYELIAPPTYWPGFDTDLGEARGNRSGADGVWSREFDNGVVVLNEPGRASTTVELGGDYRNVRGEIVSAVVLDAREAQILTVP